MPLTHTISITFEITPPGPALRGTSLSENQTGILRPKPVHVCVILLSFEASLI
ncbi:hypothetical protein PHLCEN_2v8192 [Hermanssonia centrifuga]|uniref:Uncharacterized protein n=1 Tax=Hermanssonia centrifuga TaxID=98765 RepID=A0A2R6NUD2_9APHY|nr:hypothetical protein PHLCEN_2v8192 [Hermanssonia centrifuga]